MKTFLSLVAEDLIHKFGTQLADVIVVFPNKRASLFLNQALAKASDRPIWAPQYQTISELFRSLSKYALCDPIRSVCELYQIYKQYIPHESLDHFYSWGEILLADFDDIDKHLADANKLFQNVSDFKEMDDMEFLTPEQENALKHFFDGFTVEGNTKLKNKFLQLWQVMYHIYSSFKKLQKDNGFLYEGALYRDVAEALQQKEVTLPEGKTYVFVGFNVLNDVEKVLFQCLQEKGKALFYWDYDLLYTQKGSPFEAGQFLKENLKLFPNQLQEIHFNQFCKAKEINFIAASSENAQARYLSQWLPENLTDPEKETAIVLCNESLLQPVLHALPDKNSPHPIKNSNITMGFPLKDTPIYSLLYALLSLYSDGYDKNRKCFKEKNKDNVLQHPYFKYLNTEDFLQPSTDNQALLNRLNLAISQIAGNKRNENDPVFEQLYQEALFQAHNIINRFLKLTEDNILPSDSFTLRRLLRTVLQNTTIPFHGEPAIGLQVMGVLETRNLDFRHLIMLSVNEGMLPQKSAETSFIPYSLKEPFGLTTNRHKIAVYAFYFYRLLQRAEKITLMYNTATEGSSQGEMSRFMRQLLAETDIPVTHFVLQAEQAIPRPKAISITKNLEIMRILQNSFDVRVAGSRPLSPSALNTYLDCPLKFYYAQVAKIRKPEDPVQGMEASFFGTLFHDTAQAIYTKLTERDNCIRKEDLDQLLENPQLSIMKFLDPVCEAHLKKIRRGEELKHSGTFLIAKNVLVDYLKRLLLYDREMTPFLMCEMEKEHYMTIPVTLPQGKLQIKVGGKIDRIDRVKKDGQQTYETETVRVVDYKTGGNPEEAKDLSAVIEPSEKRQSYIFQTFLYSLVLCQETKNPVKPSLFFVHKANQENYNPGIPWENHVVLEDFHELKQEFQQRLETLLQEVFNPDIPFTQTAFEKKCTFCDYKNLCGK